MRILIADDHVLLVEALTQSLQHRTGFSVSSAFTLQEALTKLESYPQDIVMLDLRMPGMAGLSSIREVVERAATGCVLLFSGSVDRQFLNEAVSLGVRGYISKTMSIETLELALRFVESGEIFIPHDEFSSIHDSNVTSGSLTDREVWVLRLAAKGVSNREIAVEIAHSESQVKGILRSAMTKLAARNRAHACMICRERMLI